MAILNGFGLVASAGVGIAEKIVGIMFYVGFFRGDILTGLFTREKDVIEAASNF